MFSEVHTDFILTPLMEVLKDGVDACTSMPVGIENGALGEYFMQSLFLRMTGAQEQKLKCICWVMATNDYRYRYDLLNVKQYGECSDYKDKKDIYFDLLTIIQRIDSKFVPERLLDGISLADGREEDIETKWKASVDKSRTKKVAEIIAQQEAKKGPLSQKAKDNISRNVLGKPYSQEDLKKLIYKEKKDVLVRDVVSRLIAMLEHSPLTSWNYREYLFFKEHYLDVVNAKQLPLSFKEFLGSKLQDDYRRIVFEHRNRTAHNTASYLKDIPTLGILSDRGYVYKNYFFRFAILLVIDEVFMRLYQRYREVNIAP